MQKTKSALTRAALLSLIFAMLLPTLVLTSCNKKKNRKFDYLSDDLSAYLLLPENKYLGHTIAVESAEITDLDVENAFLQTQAAYKNQTPEEDGAFLLDHEISAGDVVYLFYTPYIAEGDGTRIDCYGSSTSNLASTSGISPVNQSASTLEIGSGSFATGFELGLVGKNPKDYAKFDYADVGAIRDDDTLFITYTAFRTTASDSYEENAVACIRPDDTNIEALYGVGFTDLVQSMQIGITQNDIELPLPDGENEKILYSSLKVDFVRHASALPTLTVEAHFPASYDYDLFAGKTVTFECFVQKCVGYTAAEVTEEFITTTLGITEDELAPYEGDAAERYKAFLRAALEEDRKSDALTEAESEMWAYLKATSELLAYPEEEVDRIYHDNLEKLEGFYESYQSQYDSLDLFAVDYLGLDEGTDWQTYMYVQTESEVKERLILYTVMRAQNILPTEEQYQQNYDDFKDSLVGYYAEEWGVSRSYYSTDEEYKTACDSVWKEILDYYGEEYFVESAYYRFAGFRILSLFNVTLNGEPLSVPIS